MAYARSGCPTLISFLAVLLPLTLRVVRGQPSPEDLLEYSDETYLLGFAESFGNAPVGFWGGSLRKPCPAPGFLGFQGVSCDEVVNGMPYATDIDLSQPVGTNDTEKLNSTQLTYYIVGLRYLRSLTLDNNLINGSIPRELGMSKSLRALVLSNNGMSGRIHKDLCNLNLTCLQLQNNSFAGPIPDCWSSFPCVDFMDSGLTYTPGVNCVNTTTKSSCAPPDVILTPPPPPVEPLLSVGAIVGIVLGFLGLVALLTAGYVFLRRHLAAKRKEEERRRLAEDIETQISTRHFGTLRRFTVPELSKATNDFDDDNMLGEGGFSKVYKGTLEDGKEIAIKKIKDERKAGGELEFLNEVELISRAVHRNLMHSEGFCVEAGECMLVLPFYVNGSVASRTHGKEGNPLDWPTRQKIARGAAEGVAYLHTDCSPKLIHRDIKADNVLLDDSDEAIIADFGLAKEMDVKETHRTTAVKGTIGHIAPEYFVSGQCSEKTDVYAFGVFLLELISGKDVFGLTAGPESEELLLRDWVANIVRDNRLPDLVDPELQGEPDTEMGEVVKVLQVALLCMQADPNDRPFMDQVVKMLVGKGLAERWQKWQDEAANFTKEEVLQVVNTPAIWENTTTGISLESFGITGPR